MSTDLRPYPEYKDSGLPWLGRVPAHWACLPHRALFEEIKNQGHVDEPLLSVTISKGVIRQADLLANSSKKDSSNLDKSKYKLVEPEDIAYNKMRAWQGAVGISRYRGIVSPAYIVVRLRTRQNPEYFHYLFRTPGFAKEAERWSYGITSDQWSLRPAHFKMIYSSVPPRDEQDAIVRFLRSMDKKVSRFIRNRRRLIEVLNEQKQAIINRAVTRGLNPNAPLKPSGIDWLGDIPEHWELMRVKMLVRKIDQGVSPQAENMLAEDSSWGVLKAGCVNRGVFRPEQHKRLPAGYEVDLSLAVAPGDVLVSRACGSPDLVGSVGQVTLSPYRLILSDKIFRPVFRSPAHKGFVVYAMNSAIFRRQVGLAISGAEGLANNLPLSSLRDFVLPYPPLVEAEAIEVSIRAELHELEQTMSVANREADLIREYRTRLIADVVTGKVDVRGIEVPEVSEEELPALDEDNGEPDDVIDDELESEGEE